MDLLIGSNNEHKAREIQEIFDKEMPGEVKILNPSDVLEEVLDVEETGATLEMNSFLKASAFSEKTGYPCIADDTGLEIDALNGKPGVHSARFAGKESNDANNRKKVLEMLKNIPDNEKTARFKTVICYCRDGNTDFIEGICEGRIISEERGSSGFGYDPIFIPEGFDETFAEMPPEKKNELSHRGKAIKNFIRFLRSNR